MTKHRTPKTQAAAIVLLERLAALEGQRALIEQNRSEALAATNAVADGLAAPVLEEMAQIRAAVAPWWTSARDALLGGKRKSIELGGCMIGDRAGAASLVVPDKALEALGEQRWSKIYVRLTPSVDKVAVKTALDGKHGKRLRLLGFDLSTPASTFFVEPVQQQGVVGA